MKQLWMIVHAFSIPLPPCGTHKQNGTATRPPVASVQWDEALGEPAVVARLALRLYPLRHAEPPPSDDVCWGWLYGMAHVVVVRDVSYICVSRAVSYASVAT